VQLDPRLWDVILIGELCKVIEDVAKAVFTLMVLNGPWRKMTSKWSNVWINEWERENHGFSSINGQVDYQGHGEWAPTLKPLCGPKWINSHQCTSWPFCPLYGLHFFIRRRMGLITVDFFLLLTIVLFFFVLSRFSWTWPHT
jgi:hypothetical protein